MPGPLQPRPLPLEGFRLSPAEPGAARPAGMPELVHLRSLDPLWAGVVCARRVAVPMGYAALQVEGPPPGACEPSLDDVPLLPRGDLPGVFLLVPPGSDAAELALTFPGPAHPVRRLLLLP